MIVVGACTRRQYLGHATWVSGHVWRRSGI